MGYCFLITDPHQQLAASGEICACPPYTRLFCVHGVIILHAFPLSVMFSVRVFSVSVFSVSVFSASVFSVSVVPINAVP